MSLSRVKKRKNLVMPISTSSGRSGKELINHKTKKTMEEERKEGSPLDKQVGGSHYKSMAIQPVEFCMKNNLNFCQSSAIKYICRYKEKGGVQDLDKAIHFIELLKKFEYPDNTASEDVESDAALDGYPAGMDCNNWRFIIVANNSLLYTRQNLPYGYLISFNKDYFSLMYPGNKMVNYDYGSVIAITNILSNPVMVYQPKPKVSMETINSYTFTIINNVDDLVDVELPNDYSIHPMDDNHFFVSYPNGESVPCRYGSCIGTSSSSKIVPLIVLKLEK